LEGLIIKNTGLGPENATHDFLIKDPPIPSVLGDAKTLLPPGVDPSPVNLRPWLGELRIPVQSIRDPG
jgi:hypothetical protein